MEKIFMKCLLIMTLVLFIKSKLTAGASQPSPVKQLNLQTIVPQPERKSRHSDDHSKSSKRRHHPTTSSSRKTKEKHHHKRKSSGKHHESQQIPPEDDKKAIHSPLPYNPQQTNQFGMEPGKAVVKLPYGNSYYVNTSEVGKRIRAGLRNIPNFKVNVNTSWLKGGLEVGQENPKTVYGLTIEGYGSKIPSTEIPTSYLPKPARKG